jgi:hypothetical protein
MESSQQLLRATEIQGMAVAMTIRMALHQQCMYPAAILC